MKGNSTCHTFSENGKSNYDNINWDNKNKCPNRQFIGKNRSMCKISGEYCKHNCGIRK